MGVSAYRTARTAVQPCPKKKNHMMSEMKVYGTTEGKRSARNDENGWEEEA